MTIDKTKAIIIPQWMFSTLISVLTTAFITWGILTATKATLELKASSNEKRIEKLENDKVNEAELDLMIENISTQLEDIKSGVKGLDDKLDEHLKSPTRPVKVTSMAPSGRVPNSITAQDKIYN